MLFRIYAGVFDATDHGVEEFNSEDEAYEYAQQLVYDEYESYEGLHGIRTIDEIMEDEECDEEEAYRIYNEDRESQVSYWVEDVY
jgi:hypothetical protein